MHLHNHIIGPNTSLYCLIGNPVEHSFSPYIYNYLFSCYGINSVYLAFNVASSHLHNCIQGLKSIGALGMNITSPYKEQVLSSVDNLSKLAYTIGTVNTIKNVENKVYGFNTDYYGIIEAFKKNGIEVKGKRALIFGSGGTVRTLCYALESMDIKEISILNRTLEKAKKIIENFRKKRILFDYAELSNDNVKNKIYNVDIVVNATSVDLIAEGIIDLKLKSIENKKIVFFDLLYGERKTEMILQAHRHGFKTVDGLDMLIYQALKSFEIWTGINVEDKYIDLVHQLNAK